MAQRNKYRKTTHPGRFNLANPKTISSKNDMEIIDICNKAYDLIDNEKYAQALSYLESVRSDTELKLAEARRMRRYGFRTVEEVKWK